MNRNSNKRAAIIGVVIALVIVYILLVEIRIE